MKNQKLLLLAMLAVAAAKTNAASYYFDQNGTTAGYGFATNGTGSYNWNTTDLVWNTNSTGGAGTISAWSGTSDIAVFSSGSSNGYTVNLQSNISVGGITGANTTGSLTSGEAVTIQAASAQSITFAPGSVITNNFGAGRLLVFGNNVNLVGDFSIQGNGLVAIQGTGSAYSGVITISATSSGGLRIQGTPRYSSDTQVVLNSGQLMIQDNDNFTIAKLSGTGGSINGASGTSNKLTVIQSATTQYAGIVGSGTSNSATSNNFTFEKGGSGVLSWTGASDNMVLGTILVSGGSLYVRGALANTTVSGSNIVSVGASGNFGGVTTTSKGVVLQTASSQLTPGMLDTAGTLTLANGITANSGGTFNFKMNGDDGAGGLLNSKIIMTSGTLTLAGTLTANFSNLGTGGIQAGVAYDLFQATGITTTGWVIGDLPTGWTVGATPFSVSNNTLQITFTSVPEPSALSLLLVSGAVGFWLWRRRGKGDTVMRGKA